MTGMRLRPEAWRAKVVAPAILSPVGVRRRRGRRQRPPALLVDRFPGDVCISVNEEAIHGIPGKQALCEGDLVKLDLVVEKNGFYADAAVTVAVGAVSLVAGALIRAAPWSGR